MDPHEGDHVVQIVGGEHHTVVLFKSGCIYCFGRNDEGQIGIGDIYGEYRRKKAEEKKLKEEQEQAAKEQKEKEEAMKVENEPQPDQANEAEANANPD